jgi:mannose/cellobiose epimerase-like protein (N-acyl-D-glucosamine 2-epimerase family)
VDAAGNAVPAALAATLTAAAATDAAKALDEAINVVRPRLSSSTRARLQLLSLA